MISIAHYANKWKNYRAPDEEDEPHEPTPQLVHEEHKLDPDSIEISAQPTKEVPEEPEPTGHLPREPSLDDLTAPLSVQTETSTNALTVNDWLSNDEGGGSPPHTSVRGLQQLMTHFEDEGIWTPGNAEDGAKKNEEGAADEVEAAEDEDEDEDNKSAVSSLTAASLSFAGRLLPLKNSPSPKSSPQASSEEDGPPPLSVSSMGTPQDERLVDSEHEAGQPRARGSSQSLDGFEGETNDNKGAKEGTNDQEEPNSLDESSWGIFTSVATVVEKLKRVGSETSLGEVAEPSSPSSTPFTVEAQSEVTGASLMKKAEEAEPTMAATKHAPLSSKPPVPPPPTRFRTGKQAVSSIRVEKDSEEDNEKKTTAVTKISAKLNEWAVSAKEAAKAPKLKEWVISAKEAAKVTELKEWANSAKEAAKMPIGEWQEEAKATVQKLKSRHASMSKRGKFRFMLVVGALALSGLSGAVAARGSLTAAATLPREPLGPTPKFHRWWPPAEAEQPPNARFSFLSQWNLIGMGNSEGANEQNDKEWNLRRIRKIPSHLVKVARQDPTLTSLLFLLIAI